MKHISIILFFFLFSFFIERLPKNFLITDRIDGTVHLFLTVNIVVMVLIFKFFFFYSSNTNNIVLLIGNLLCVISKPVISCVRCCI